MTPAADALRVDLVGHLDAHRWSGYQKMIVALAALAFASDGIANQLIGIAMPAILGEWAVNRAAMAPVAALGLVGVMLGSALGGMLCDKVGRRLALIGAIALFSIMNMLTALVQNVPMLEVVRFLAGLGIGAAIPSGAALITEVTPRRSRALALALGMMFVGGGGFLAGLLGAAIMPAFGWRALFLISGIGALAVVLLFLFVLPESPGFLAQKDGRHRSIMLFFARCGHPVEDHWVFCEIAADDGKKSGLLTLFRPPYLSQTIGIWLGFFCCLLASYTMFSWLPTMLSVRDFSLRDTSLFMSAYHGGAIFGGLLAGIVMQKYGARVPSMAVAILGAIAVAGLAYLPLHAAHNLVLIGLLCSAGLLMAGLHNGVYTLAAMAYPSQVRGTGVGAASAFGRLGAVASSYTGVITMGSGGNSFFFVFIAIVLAIATIGFSWLRPQPGY